jgi:fatty-acyl-CoA synthase
VTTPAKPQSRTLPALLDEIAAREPGREFLVDARQRLTYAEARARVREIARGLHALGIRRGDKIALLMNNRVEWLLAGFAVTMLGATLVPISTWSRGRELGYVLDHCDATTLITVDRFLGQDYVALLAELGGPGSDRLPRLEHVVILGAAQGGFLPFERLAELGGEVGDAAVDACAQAVSPGDVAYILYTSGTTSAPKGVQLRHGGLVENTWNIGERQHLGADDRLWMAISMFWSFACANGLLAVMTHGGAVVLQEQFEPASALALMERERCTVYYGTPNIALALWEHPDRPRRDLSSLRTGATIGPPAAIQMVMDLGARQICNVYGLTECYGNSNVTDAADPAEVRLDTVGLPLPGMEIRVVDRETREPLPPGSVGEILIRGLLTPGYYKDPARNEAAFDRDGFFLTGDLGAIGEDGRLRFRGRIKEMVKTGGINVAPVEIEEVLLGHPAVEQVYCVGLPDPRLEEVLAAVVVLKDGCTASEEELRAHCRRALAAFKVPQRFRIVGRAELPVTATGKVQKFRLQEMLTREAGNAAPGAV